MIKLIQNECIKLFHQKSNFFWWSLEPMLILLGSFIYKAVMFSQHAPLFTSNDILQTLGDEKLASLTNVIVVIIAIQIIAKEFENGTINILVIQSYTRTNILISKFIAMCLFALWLNFIMIVASYFCSGLVLGFESPLRPALGLAQPFNVLNVAIGETVSNWQMDILYIAIAFFIALVFRSQVFAVLLGLLMVVFNSGINAFFLVLAQNPGFDWIKWSLFNMFNLRNKFFYFTAQIPLKIYEISYWQMLLGLTIYTGIFIFLSILIFDKRDIRKH